MTRVLMVKNFEPLSLRKSWMKALAEGIAWLELLRLAYGDLRPENILVNEQDHVKVIDSDCTNFIGSEFEVYIPLYGRLLGSEAGLDKGSVGKLGARIEQFTLGSIFYYINYGIKVYNDQNFSKDHGLVVVERLEEMIFLKLNTTLMSNLTIDDCWHGRFYSVAELSRSISHRFDLSNYSYKSLSLEEFTARRTYCLQLVEGGILDDVLRGA